MNQPLISVIIPAHNSAQTIGTAVDSMLAQTYPNLEIVVIDDNSTDNTREIAQNYEKRCPNLRFYALPYDDPKRFNKRGRNINAGYMARNFGFEKVRGAWITFQDADDASLRNRIKVQYELAIRYNKMHVCIDWQQFRNELLGKTLDVDSIVREHADVAIGTEDILLLAEKTKGILPRLERIHTKISFELKRMRVLNKLFFSSLASYPCAANSPLFKKEIADKVRFRPLDERVWPSFTGRGADRDFNFAVAETFRSSMSFRLPLYLYRATIQHVPYEGYEKYLHSSPL